MMIGKILSLAIWLLAVPFCMGLLFLPFLEKTHRTFQGAWIVGYLLWFTLLELVGIPITLLTVYHGFTTFMKWFTVLVLLCAFSGIGVALAFRKKGQRLLSGRKLRFREISLEEKLVYALFFLIVGFQLYMAFTRASFDGDDAYYGVQAVIAQQIDTLYRINPYTGKSSPLDVRHGLALFPIWEAYVGSISGVHATIVAHTVVPLALIPLTYLLYFQIGSLLLQKRKDLLPMFMVVMGLWQMFGNVSIYTTETFFLTRTWQGKSFAGNFVIPAVLWIFLSLAAPGEKTGFTGREKRGLWILLGCLNFAGGASSSLAILLSCLMSLGFGFLFAVRKKRFGILLRAGLSCVPGGVYVLLYLLLTHGILQV